MMVMCVWREGSFWLNCAAFLLLDMLPVVILRDVVSLHVFV